MTTCGKKTLRTNKVVKVIKANPPRRFCTKAKPEALRCPNYAYCVSVGEYITVFSARNFLKPSEFTINGVTSIL